MLRFMLVACLMAFVVPSQISAQFYGGDIVTRKQVVDVIYLKDGQIVRGIILEKTDESLSVRTGDGRVHTIMMDQVARMFQEEQARMGMGGKKSVPFAIGLSALISGGGQFYNGQPVKGGIQLGIFVVGIGIWISGANDASTYVGGGSGGTKVMVGALLTSGNWLWSVIDAGISADNINKKNEYGHLIELRDDRFVLGVDPAVQRNGLGTMLTLHF